MAAESLVQMLEEIAIGLKAGDEEIYGWLREQLKECGASEISVELAMGVIAARQALGPLTPVSLSSQEQAMVRARY